MAWLWGQLFELYGSKAEIKYGEVGGEVFNSWCQKLSVLEPDDIKRGLEACLYREEPWPPELQEFMRSCLQTKQAPCHEQYLALPILKSTRDYASKCIKEIRDLLK